ncbi:putative PHD type zinc finger protein with BAH domain-containing protein [Vanrija albida]|uniref:PHD type zinc finger protein with BAH domain-containing protein n=1 Tax=Vanrija albida TaxID=181172 RepID=A0ABR3Q4X3_9TREE
MPSRQSDMAQQGFKVNSVKAANGETVHVNDHVYISLPWSDRDGTPYNIARILEFVPPANKDHRKAARGHANELHVRLAIYYRPSDVVGRNVSDFRLLYAAIHTMIEPVSVIRGRCYVRHKDKIDDLIKWKHTPDHFYFNKFYDPYIKREYEVLRTAAVNNIPPNVKEVLLQRYEYLICEKEMVSDLLDAYRSCAVCHQWASSQTSVRCELCKQFYHMQCLTPPLSAKPAKGYSWGCQACTVQRRKDVESEKYRFVSNGGSAPPRGGKVAAAAKAAARKERLASNDQPDVMFRFWPWRYFGLYTRAEDTLSAEDLIFPRAVTRVGTKYQANVLSWEEQVEAEARHEAGPSRLSVERGYDPGEKKHESTLEVWCTPSDELDNFMEEIRGLSLPVPSYDIRLLNRAPLLFTTVGRDKALQALKSLKLADFNPIVWEDEEIAVFEEQLEKNGGLDAWAVSKALGKRPAEVLKFSYMWKNKKLKTENELIRQHRKVHAVHARNNSKTLGAPSLGKIRSRAESEATDDAVSLYGAAYVSTNRMQCATCSTRMSNVWWRCPRSVQGTAMCEPCGSNYRKYGVITFTKAEDAKIIPKKEPRGTKRKGDTASGASTPVPTGPPKLPPCSSCKKMEPKAAMARCKTCTYSVHSTCYGIAPDAMGPNWECDLCSNVKIEETNLEPRCVLCPKDTSLLVSKTKSKKPPADFDLLAALKPTEGCRWAHVLCATCIPEVRFSSSVTYKKVEGISAVSDEKWHSVCNLCAQTDGATMPCSDCGLEYHPSCAYQAGHRIGFEFSLVKPGRRDAVPIAKFRDAAGVMTPGIWCKGHDLEGRGIVDLFDMDPEQNENALQIYTSLYKTIAADDSFALLRKARRLDRFEPEPTPAAVEYKCSSCAIDVSPRWHADGAGVKCHQCYVAAIPIAA